MWAILTLSLTAGAVAAFNPCGFAMLPAYLGYFIGQESDDETNVARNVLRGLMVGLTITLGFVALFTVIGVLATSAQSAVQEHIPKVTLVLGVLLVPLGITMLLGYEPRLNLPRLNRGGKTRGFGSIFGFGVSYAVVSLSCTAPIFFGTVIGSFTGQGWTRGMVAFVAYGVGMGMVVMVLTMATALARNEIATSFRKVLPYVNRISGLLLVLAGIFLVIYAWWEIQVLAGNASGNWLIDQSTLLQSTATNWIADIGGSRLTVVAVLLIGGILALAFRKSMAEAQSRLALGGLVGVWALAEVFSGSIDNGEGRFDLVIKPFARTVASIPERIGNWFTDTLRWQTLGELLFTLVLVTVVGMRLRRTQAQNPGGSGLSPAPDKRSEEQESARV